MSFFVTERGSPTGGNLGGLAGADARCQAAASAAGVGGRSWRAYLSASSDATFGRVDARDRIGSGPWRNHAGALVGDLASIHFESGGGGIAAEAVLTECGRVIRYTDELADHLTKHDVMTGSDREGRLMLDLDPSTGLRNGPPLTCDDWRSSAGPSDTPTYRTWVGHTDHEGDDQSWNSAHDTIACDLASLAEYVGNGGIYCFAID